MQNNDFKNIPMKCGHCLMFWIIVAALIILPWLLMGCAISTEHPCNNLAKGSKEYGRYCHNTELDNPVLTVDL